MNNETGWTDLEIINDESLEGLASQISRDKPRMVRISPEGVILVREREGSVCYYTPHLKYKRDLVPAS